MTENNSVQLLNDMFPERLKCDKGLNICKLQKYSVVDVSFSARFSCSFSDLVAVLLCNCLHWKEIVVPEEDPLPAW